MKIKKGKYKLLIGIEIGKYGIWLYRNWQIQFTRMGAVDDLRDWWLDIGFIRITKGKP